MCGIYYISFFPSYPKFLSRFSDGFSLEIYSMCRYFLQIPTNLFKHSVQSKYLVITAKEPYGSRNGKTYYGKGVVSKDGCELRK